MDLYVKLPGRKYRLATNEEIEAAQKSIQGARDGRAVGGVDWRIQAGIFPSAVDSPMLGMVFTRFDGGILGYVRWYCQSVPAKKLAEHIAVHVDLLCSAPPFVFHAYRAETSSGQRGEEWVREVLAEFGKSGLRIRSYPPEESVVFAGYADGKELSANIDPRA